MSLVWQGALLGLSLSVLAGPMLFVLVQLGMERGFRAGATAGAGVWVSDTLYVLSAYWGISYLIQITQWQGFKLWASVMGGLVLIIMGVATLLARPALQQQKEKAMASTHWFSLWAKGFLINTINPFTAFFWIGVMTTTSANGPLPATDATAFFGSIIGVIILTDILKVLLAKRIKKWMSYRYLLAMRRVAGTALVVFGVFLMVRGML
ncbi:MAG: LysE family translocator [Lewinellaceae bacterium]|nr:LysE family translocator [Lewinellaceae bacterium]